MAINIIRRDEIHATGRILLISYKNFKMEPINLSILAKQI